MQFPQSWGPLHKRADRWICKKLGRKLSHISARGEISAKLACELGYAEKTLNLPDIVLTMAELGDLPFQVDPNTEKRGLGIAPIEFGFARECNEDDRYRYLDKLTEIAIRYHQKTTQPITLFVQVSIPDHDDDAPMAEKLFERLQKNSVPVTIENNSDPIAYHKSIHSQSCFIGCRMHSCIFAMVAGVPTLGLAYQPKFMELFRELDLEDRCFDISTFDSLSVCNTLLQHEFSSAASRQKLAASVKQSATRLLEGLDVCWDAAGLQKDS
jgi:colanic acid/amylovoran biosynthesis protein